MKERFHAIDALRVFAMVSVVFLHSSISYMPTRLPDLLWAVHDPSATAFFDWLFFWIRGLTMRVFFLVAGFFAGVLYEDRGPKAFLENRLRRIAIPFLVGSGVLLPLLYFIWCYGWLETGRADLSQVLRMRLDAPIQRNLYGPAHLWFLEFLVLFYAVYYAFRRVRPGFVRPGGVVEKIIFSRLRPLALAVPSMLILWLDVDVVINFHNTFIPNPLKFLYYGFFFLAGTWLYPFRERLQNLAAGANAYLAASLPVFIGMVALTRAHIAKPLAGPGYFALVAATSLFAWLSVFAMLGYFMRFLNREIPLVRYLSGASYWIYLCHLPVVGLMQVFLLRFELPAALKFSAVVLTALGSGFLTYEVFVRNTSIGLCLSGPKHFGGMPPRPLTLKVKTTLTAFMLCAVVLSGTSFQHFYNEEKKRYEGTLAGFYRQYLHREPDAVGWRHWTDWALNRWGLEKVERIGFIEAGRKEGKERA